MSFAASRSVAAVVATALAFAPSSARAEDIIVGDHNDTRQTDFTSGTKSVFWLTLGSAAVTAGAFAWGKSIESRIEGLDSDHGGRSVVQWCSSDPAACERHERLRDAHELPQVIYLSALGATIAGAALYVVFRSKIFESPKAPTVGAAPTQGGSVFTLRGSF